MSYVTLNNTSKLFISENTPLHRTRGLFFNSISKSRQAEGPDLRKCFWTNCSCIYNYSYVFELLQCEGVSLLSSMLSLCSPYR